MNGYLLDKAEVVIRDNILCVEKCLTNDDFIKNRQDILDRLMIARDYIKLYVEQLPEEEI